MRIIFSICIAIAQVAFGQTKFEVQEFSGRILAIHPGWGFYLENIEVDLQPESRVFKLHPTYGKSILSKFKVGDEIRFKANVNVTIRERFNSKELKEKKDYSKRWGYQFAERIVEIWLDGQWVKVPYFNEQNGEPVTSTSEDRKWVANTKKETPPKPSVTVKLEQKTTGEYLIGKERKGLFLGEKTVLYCNHCEYKGSKFQTLKASDRVSFIAFESRINPEYLYLVNGIEKVYPLGWVLEKQKGKIDAFIMKQNSVRIGLNLSGTQLSFPAEFGKAMERFANGKSVTVYYEGSKDERSNLLPSIHAVIQGADTLFINQFFYGAPDGKHEYKPAEVNGKITLLQRAVLNRLTGIVLNEDCFIETDGNLEKQLGTLLKEGVTIKVTGEERIKKEGEVYEKNYRIIAPRRIEVAGKEFILNK